MTSPVFTPLQMFYSTSGLPLTDGYIYIGTASQNPQTNPIAVYWDAAGTIPAAQPIRTSGGYPVRNGSPATVFVLATDFSLIVRDKSSKLVFSRLSGNAFSAEWVTYTPAGTGAVATTVQAKLRESVSVLDFYANGVSGVSVDPTGVVDSTLGIQAAIDSIANDGVVAVPAGTYKLSATLTLGASGKGARLVGVGKPTLVFFGLGAAADGVVLSGSSYRQVQLENCIIDMNNTGRDGVRLTVSDRPFVRNVTVRKTIQDGFSYICAGYNWIENGVFENLLVENAGRHAYYLETSGANGAFINESIWKQCECRGVSVKQNNGAAVYARCAGSTSGSKLSELQWQDCNFDAMRQTAITNGFDVNPNPMVLAYHAGGTSNYESWTILGGGWETTSGGPDYRELGLIKLESGAEARGWFIKLGSPGGWSGGGLNGKFLDYFLHNKQVGTVRAPFLNSWRQQSAATSSSISLDIPIPFVHLPFSPRLVGGNWYEVAVWGYQYSGTGHESWKNDLFLKYYATGADAYWVQAGTAVTTLAGADQFTVTSMTVINSSGTTTLNDANPPAFVRLNITTSANWATGGGDNIFHGVVALKGSTHGEYYA